MTHTDVTTSADNPVSTGLSLRYVGEHAYAISGSVQDAGSDAPDTTLLDFATRGSYLVGTLDFTTDLASGHNLYFNIKFNGLIVDQNKEATTSNIPMRFYVLIPPFTHVEVNWGAGTTANGSAFLQSRVYGAA